MSKKRRINDLEVRVAKLEHARRNLLISMESTDRAMAALQDQIADLEYAERTRLKSDPHTQQCQSDRSDPVGRSADLRTRIAAIIDREVDGFWEPLDVADVLIRELKLDQPVDFTSVAWGIPSFDNGTADE